LFADDEKRPQCHFFSGNIQCLKGIFMQRTNEIAGDIFTLKCFPLLFVVILVFFSSGLCGVNSCSRESGEEVLEESSVYGDVFIAVERQDPFPNKLNHGYVEYVISLSNNSSESHIITLAGPADSYGGGDHIRRISRTIELLPSAKTKISFFQPPVEVRGGNLEVIIDGKKQRKTIKLEYCRLEQDFYGSGSYAYNRRRSFNVLLSPNVSYDSFKKNNPTSDQSPPKKAANDLLKEFGECEFLPARSLVEKWSDNWLAYTGYDGIVTTKDDINSMPIPVISAVLKYIRCGGSLLVIGKWDGAGKLADTQETLGQLQLNYIGFGVCAVCDSNDVEKWEEQTWQIIRTSLWEPVGEETAKHRTIVQANSEFSIVDSLAIPVRGLFLLVLIFAIVIGPVNLWVLGRMRRRIWMLWTVPLIAIVTSAAIFFYAVFSEGLDANSRICAITILDGKTHTATTIGVNAFYCPLTPRGGLHYDYQTELTPLGLQHWGGGRDRYVDWTNDQSFSAGWVIGRVPAHFLLRKSQTVAEPIRIVADSENQLVVHNNLGVGISRLLYADGQGNIHSAENIASAGQKKLIQMQQSIGNSGKPDILREVYASSWATAYKVISASPEKYLKLNTCIAVLKGAPFVEDALPAAKLKNFESVAVCLMKGSDDAGRSK
jgi:hypothetical protein